MSKPLKIDVEELIRSKNPKLLKWIPGFIIRYLKRIIHQDDVNSFIFRNKDKKNQDFCKAVVDEFELNLSIKGLENIPTSGPATIVLNHPLGGMDAIAFVHLISSRRKDVKFIVNDLLLHLDGMKEMFVGVNKHGSNSRDSKRKVAELFESDELICVFPAGLVSRKKQGKIEDLNWKKTFVTMSKKTDRPIIPVHIEGKLSNFFYRLSNIRTFFGIKVNLEMLYLVNELYKQQREKIDFTVGQPIAIQRFDSSKSDQEWAKWTKEKVYQLAEK